MNYKMVHKSWCALTRYAQRLKYKYSKFQFHSINNNNNYEDIDLIRITDPSQTSLN